MRRRYFLTTAGAVSVFSLSGCLRRFRTDTATNDLGERVSSNFGDFSLETVNARQSVVTGSETSPDVVNPVEGYLLLIGGTTYGEAISQTDINNFKSDFTFEYQTGNETATMVFDQRVGTTGTELSQDFYLIARLPERKTSFDQGTLRYETPTGDYRWDIPGILPDDVQSYMKDQPRFEVQNVNVPDSASGSAPVSITVAETAGANLRSPESFNVVLSSGNPPTQVESIPVGGGETVTESFDVDLNTPAGQGVIIVSWGRRPQKYQITVEQ